MCSCVGCCHCSTWSMLGSLRLQGRLAGDGSISAGAAAAAAAAAASSGVAAPVSPALPRRFQPRELQRLRMLSMQLSAGSRHGSNVVLLRRRLGTGSVEMEAGTSGVIRSHSATSCVLRM